MRMKRRRHRLWLRLCLAVWLTGICGQGYAQSPPDTTKSVRAQRREAMKQFLAALAIAKNNLAATYYVKGQYDSAGVQLRDVLTIAPDFAAAHLTLGLIYYDRGKYLEAVKAFKTAAPDDSVSRKKMEQSTPNVIYAWAKQQFNKIIRGKPDLAAAHTALARVYQGGGFKEDAERHYLEAIASDSSYVRAYIHLGELYTDARLFDDAIRVLERAPATGRELPAVYFTLGVAYMGANRVKKAVGAWRRVIAEDPKNAQAYMNLGIAYQRQAMDDSAVASWKRSIEMKPGFLAPRVALARLYTARRKYQGAIAEYRQALDTGARDPRLYMELGFAYEMLEKYDEALAQYRKALELDPKNPDILGAIEMADQKKEQREAARRAHKIRVRQIVVRTTQKAQEILAALKDGADFAELARKRSIDPSAAEGGDLGYFGPGEMIPEIEKAAMGLEVGAISGIVETPMGFHIIKRIE